MSLYCRTIDPDLGLVVRKVSAGSLIAAEDGSGWHSVDPRVKVRSEAAPVVSPWQGLVISSPLKDVPYHEDALHRWMTAANAGWCGNGATVAAKLGLPVEVSDLALSAILSGNAIIGTNLRQVFRLLIPTEIGSWRDFDRSLQRQAVRICNEQGPFSRELLEWEVERTVAETLRSRLKEEIQKREDPPDKRIIALFEVERRSSPDYPTKDKRRLMRLQRSLLVAVRRGWPLTPEQTEYLTLSASEKFCKDIVDAQTARFNNLYKSKASKEILNAASGCRPLAKTDLKLASARLDFWRKKLPPKSIDDLLAQFPGVLSVDVTMAYQRCSLLIAAKQKKVTASTLFSALKELSRPVQVLRLPLKSFERRLKAYTLLHKLQRLFPEGEGASKAPQASTLLYSEHAWLKALWWSVIDRRSSEGLGPWRANTRLVQRSLIEMTEQLVREDRHYDPSRSVADNVDDFFYTVAKQALLSPRLTAGRLLRIAHEKFGLITTKGGDSQHLELLKLAHIQWTQLHWTRRERLLTLLAMKVVPVFKEFFPKQYYYRRSHLVPLITNREALGQTAKQLIISRNGEKAAGTWARELLDPAHKRPSLEEVEKVLKNLQFNVNDPSSARTMFFMVARLCLRKRDLRELSDPQAFDEEQRRRGQYRKKKGRSDG